MNELDQSRTPGVVLFAAVLNFLSALLWGAWSLIFLLAVIFGTSMSVFQAPAAQLQQSLSDRGIAIGVTLLFFIALVLSAAFCVLHLLIGLGLLKTKRYAWFLQIATSVVGLLFVPWGTILSIALLILFFGRPVRDRFRV